MLLTTYTLSGLICGIAAWVADRPHRLGVAVLGGEFANIESITAVVIGGISLFGGRGSILGT
jgi:fructose transport system permease protein